MKQSLLFAKTTREITHDEISLNAQLLIRAGFISKIMAGVYALSPLGLKVLKKIEDIIRSEINAIGGQEVLMPALQPQTNWEKTKRWNTYDGLIKLGLNEEKNLVLGPTHEEIIAPWAKKFIFSYQDLPRYVYQFQNKFRGEKRAKSGLLRGREFIMKDLYSFHESEKDLDQYYDKVAEAYIRIFRKMGLEEKTYFTYASGGTFSQYSHEFQTLTPAGEDIIYICDKCRVAVNREIIEDQKHRCPKCGNQELREEKAVETGNIFKLGTNYSRPFDLNFVNQKGIKKPVIMGCYGIGLQRLMGTIVEIYNDERGILWPKKVAPFDLHLISLNKNQETEKTYATLSQEFDVLYDDRDLSIGEKLAEADLIGLPLRLIVSDRSLEAGGYELKKREEKESQIIGVEDLMETIGKIIR